jgi:hypothetical protein
MIGLSHGNTNASYKDIDFAFYLYSDGTYWINENLTGPGASVSGPYQPGDRFRVELTGTTVRYKQNGQLRHTSTHTPELPLLVDTSILTPNASIKNVTLGGTFAENVPPVSGGPLADCRVPSGAGPLSRGRRGGDVGP